MSLPKKSTKDQPKKTYNPIAKDKKRTHRELFEIKDGKLISKTDLTVAGNKYKVGDEITETKFNDFDLFDVSESFIYIINKKTLIARVSMK